MPLCFFVTDLHGQVDRYHKLFRKIEEEKPEAIFLGGDLMPSSLNLMIAGDHTYTDFFQDILLGGFRKLQQDLGKQYPRVFLILGNDDGLYEESNIIAAAEEQLWEYSHNSITGFGDLKVCGYSFVPPSPFRLKDWERYDVGRYVDPGSISPEEGSHSVDVEPHTIRYATIKKDLDRLTGEKDLSRTICLFHTPPYQTKLDRAALDGKMIDHVPLDLHVGSIAVKRFIEQRQPLLTLHGHIHESARLTGDWKDKIGETLSFSAAHDGPELSLVRFNPDNLQESTRELI
jgi:Icc-related predicted phosphoesterase